MSKLNVNLRKFIRINMGWSEVCKFKKRGHSMSSRQEEVGGWSKKYSFLSTFRVKIVYVEVGT